MQIGCKTRQIANNVNIWSFCLLIYKINKSTKPLNNNYLSLSVGILFSLPHIFISVLIQQMNPTFTLITTSVTNMMTNQLTKCLQPLTNPLIFDNMHNTNCTMNHVNVIHMFNRLLFHNITRIFNVLMALKWRHHKTKHNKQFCTSSNNWKAQNIFLQWKQAKS